MTKEELKRNIELLERNIESPIFQCRSNMAMIIRNATRYNYGTFAEKEISKEEFQDNNNRIFEVTSRFVGMCSCMREKIP